MSANAETDTKVVVDVSLDEEPVCEVTPEGEGTCTEPAKWVATLKCCGFMSLVCDKHKRWVLDLLAQRRLTGIRLLCVVCEADYKDPVWRPL